MTIDTTMAVESVTANSRNRRPTIPPINSSGMKTAISEMLMVKTVKPISSRALQRRGDGRHAVFQMPRDVFHHHDGIVHHEAGRDGQRHQREVVEAVAEQIHHRASADQRDRHGDGGNERGAAVAQEDRTPRG